MNSLERLQVHTKIVADTVNINHISQYSPIDVSTNPQIIAEYGRRNIVSPLLQQAFSQEYDYEFLCFSLSEKILPHIPGRIFIQVDPRCYNAVAMVNSAEKILAYCREHGIENNRIIIKLPATWQGIQALTQLKKKNMTCCLTMIFTIEQAMTCAKLGANVIAPFAASWKQWQLQQDNDDNDLGITLVQEIQYCIKQQGLNTEILGYALDLEQAIELANIDALCLTPTLLNELQQSEQAIKESKLLSIAGNIEDFFLSSEAQYHALLNKKKVAKTLLENCCIDFEKSITDLFSVNPNTLQVS